jgi:TolB-like protein/DNA-binding winged helix-turn-helix (wHTH) protein/tetratricopeptide (TPR) repeat protein
MESPAPQPILRFGPFELDVSAGQLRRNGANVHIQDKPLRLLTVLAGRHGKLVSREELHKALWPGQTFGEYEDGLNTAVKKLRETLSDRPEKPQFIETVPRRGYRFIVPVQEVFDAPPAGLKTDANLDTNTASAQLGFVVPEQRQPFRWVNVLASALAIVVVASTYVAWRHFRPKPQLVPASAMLAVLPFENLTGDAEEEYVSDGFTEEIITQLGRLNHDQLRVIARTSMMTYKGSHKPVNQIARELGVNYVLEGSIRNTGDGLRVTAQLIRADDQTHLWAREYDRPLGDLVKVQGEVAEAVAQEIQVRLSPKVEETLAGVAPVDPEVYSAYLKGRFFWNKRSRDGLTMAVGFFEQAVQRNPNYAPAYAGLADAYNALVFYGFVSGPEGIPKAKAAATRAVELDGSRAEGHASLGYIYFMWEWNWAAAEREFQRAIELNGNYVPTYQWYALYLAAMGRGPESLAQIRQARELDPFSVIVAAESGYVAFFARQNDQAAAEAEAALQKEPDFMVPHAVLGLASEAQGNYGKAILEFQKALQLSNSQPAAYLDYLGHAYAISGNRREAKNILAKINQNTQAVIGAPAYRAATLVALGEKAEALKALEGGFEKGSYGFMWIKVDPRFDVLRSDSRFQSLMSRAGLLKVSN